MAIRGILLIGLLLVSGAGDDDEDGPEFTLQDILEGLASDDDFDRWRAAVRATKTGADARAAVPLLIRALGAREENTRTEVASALGAIGPDAAAAVPALLRTARDGVGEVRGAAVTALAGIGVKTEPVVALVLRALADADGIVRANALEAIFDLELPAETVLAPLLVLARDESTPPRLRGMALWNIGRLAVDTPEVRDVLLKAASVEELSVRSGVVYCLRTLGPRDRALEVLIHALSHRSRDLRIEACRTLAFRGGDSDAVVAALVARLHDTETLVRLAAARTLHRLGWTEGDLVARFIGWIADHPDPEVRLRAVDALGSFGPGAHAAVPALTARLADGYASIRATAARALVGIGEAAKPARKALEKNLTDEAAIVRIAAARALALLGIEVSRSVEALLRDAAFAAVTHEAAGIPLGDIGPVASRKAAVVALGEIGPAAAAALPHLDRAVTAEVHAVRVAAAAAAARIRARD